MLSLYLLHYAILSLTILKTPIYPTISRVTIFGTVVNWTITGSLQMDIVILSVLFSATVFFLFRSRISIPLSIMAVSTSLVPATMQNQAMDLSSFVVLIGLPIIASLALASRFTALSHVFRLSHDRFIFDVRLFLAIFFLILTIMGTWVLFRWSILPFTSDEPYSNWSWTINSLETNLFYAAGLLSPYLILLSLVSFAYRKYLVQLLQFVRMLLAVDTPGILVDSKVHFINLRTILGALQVYFNFDERLKSLLIVGLAAIIPSILMPLYAYTTVPEVVDPNVVYLGTDIFIYSERLAILESYTTDIPQFLQQVFFGLDGGSRSLTYLVLYVLYDLSGQGSTEILKIVPTILGPFIVLSSYFLVRTAYPNHKKLPVIAAVVTAFSHQIVIGFYAAYYANWMALITMLMASAFLLKNLQNTSLNVKNLSLFAGFTIATLLFHSYAWSYFTAAITLFLVWSGIRNRLGKRSLRNIIILSAIMAAVIALDISKSSYSGGVTSFENDLSLADSTISVDEFNARWLNLNSTFRFYLGGFLTNSVTIALLLVWTIRARYNKDSDRLLLSMLFIGLLPILFGDYVVQARIFYIIPLQIPASIVLYKILQFQNKAIGVPLFLSLLLMQANYSIRAMANMYLNFP